MNLNHHTRKYWNDEDLLALEQADTMPQMLQIALGVLKRMPQPVAQVCGPISTGGRGSILENLVAFNETIVFLQAEGESVFDQMPFEAPMQRVKTTLPKGQYALTLLDDFYLPIFETGLIKKMYFMPDWESSHGAKWEHEQAKRLGIEIKYL
jgi:hypothetical protein